MKIIVVEQDDGFVAFVSGAPSLQAVDYTAELAVRKLIDEVLPETLAYGATAVTYPSNERVRSYFLAARGIPVA